MTTPVDFIGLAAALLERAETLVPLWLPEGYKKGRYWYVGDFDGSPGKSANVNLRTGKWGDNGSPGDAGVDLISLYRRVRRLGSMSDAARELMADNGWRDYAATPPPPKRARKQAEVDWMPLHPVPEDAPPYREQWAHYARGVPPLHWEYRDRAGRLLGLTVRFETSTGGKDVQPISYCQGSNGQRAWRYKAFGQPRPLYGLWRLASAQPGDLVVLVEGEKKADRLFEALDESTPVVSWPGGCNTVHMADWQALQGFDVLAWPDADSQVDKITQELRRWDQQPGMVAMQKAQQLLAGVAQRVRIVDIGPPGQRSDGWDAADAVAEGWTREQLWAFMRNTLSGPPEAAGPAAQPGGGGGGGDAGAPPPPSAARADGGDPRWREGYHLERGQIAKCVPNVMLVLHEHPQWQGVLGFDQFAQRVVKMKPAPYEPEDRPGPGWSNEWTDIDDTRAAAWITRREGWVPSAGMVAEAANETAHANPYHPVLEYLAGLEHDGTPRIDHWLSDHLGVDDKAYTRLVSRYFLIGMCKRVLQPGVKFDYCLVLEGTQGKRKSSALRVLAGEWFSDIELDLSNKDAMSNIRGKWLHEFGEMGSLARSESNRQKSFLSRQVDEFRPTYGRREIRCPRQTVFAGTTNEWQWNKDPTGGRRFWPVDVKVDEIDLEKLAACRDQLFAEAFALARQGERYWPSADEQRELFDPEQLARESPDAFVEMLGEWLDSPAQLHLDEFTLAQACTEGLKLDARALSKDVQTRVGIALRKLECERVERRTAAVRFVYRRPSKKAASSASTSPTATDRAEVPF